jgi:TonB family protein
MRSPPRALGWPLLACAVGLAAGASRADESKAATAGSASASGSASSPPAKGLVAPRLRSAVDPKLPDGKLKPGDALDAAVELTLDATGHIVDVELTKSSGDGEIDLAVVAAARRLEFEPAYRDGKPIKAKIPYRFDLVAPPAPVASTSASTSSATPPPAVKSNDAEIRGAVRTADDQPIAGARVTVTFADGSTRVAGSGADGSFLFRKLSRASAKLHVEAAGFAASDVDVAFGPDGVTEPSVKLAPAEVIEIEVKGERPREVVKRELEQRELSRIPGTGGDALRAIQSLPGVARPPGLSGLLIVRGSAPSDTQVFVDGTLVPIAYHFGGLSSVIPTELIEKLDFYPGNFSAEYGRAMGGIIDVGLKSPNKEKLSGLLQFDLIDGRMVIEGPIDEHTRFIAAGRRSWVDAWLGPVLRSTGAGVSTAPRYYDYQLMVERDFGASTTGRLTFYGSDDALAITVPDPSDSDPALGGDLSLSTSFWRVQARTDTRFGKDARWVNTVGAGQDHLGFALGDNLFFKLTNNAVSWRSDYRVKIAKDVSAIVGMDWLWSAFSVDLKAPPQPPQGQAGGPFFSQPATERSSTGNVYRPAVYALLDLRPTKRLTVLPGVRIDYTKDTTEWDVSPRLTARYDLVPEFPRTTLKGGVGLFHQPPQPQESFAPFGTPGIHNNRAVHYDLGLEQEFTRQVELSFDAFYKDLQSLVVGTASVNTNGAGITYGNAGTGRTYGAEVLLKYKPDDKFFGWLAYTLSRSERQDGPGQPTHLFQYDQTHILTVLGSYRLGRGWEAGVRFRFISGSMYTPNIGGTVDFDAGAYSPVQSYPLYSARLPAFHQLDIRVDKKWQFKQWALGIYLDIQNVYNRQNPEGISYNYNYSQSSVVAGLPIIPNFGIRGEL